MKQVQFNRYGDASEMFMGESTLPDLKRGQVRVAVKAAAINPLDWKQREGAMKLFMSRKFPKGMGSDFAGIVEAVGSDVSNVRPGDEVFGTMSATNPGAFAEALVTDSGNVTKKPSQLSFAQAACLPIPATTAWVAVLIKGRAAKQTRVLINGCTGAVGLAAVQLATAHGARVAGTCSQTSMAVAKLAAVDPVFDYRSEDLWKDVEPFDLIFDTSGTMDVSRGLSLLKAKGVFVDINPTPSRMLRGLLSFRYKLAFATMATKHLPEIAQLAANGVLKPMIGLEKPFSEAVATIAAVEKGHRAPGKVVLIF